VVPTRKIGRLRDGSCGWVARRREQVAICSRMGGRDDALLAGRMYASGSQGPRNVPRPFSLKWTDYCEQPAEMPRSKKTASELE
jgi:hypothetical protein